MRIPVILVAPTHAHLRSAAAAATINTAAGLDLAQAPSYPGVELDASFAPVPLGSAEAGGATMAEVAPNESRYFAVRGYIETGDGLPPPTRAGEAAVFSDPQIPHADLRRVATGR